MRCLAQTRLCAKSGAEMRKRTETNEMGSLLRKMSMPLIFSMLVQVLYGLVDSLYVARLGDNALTAISLCMPVQFLVLGVGTGIGVGVKPVSAGDCRTGDECDSFRAVCVGSWRRPETQHWCGWRFPLWK